MIPDDSRSRDHRGVTWERQLARSTRSYLGTAVERAVEDNITCFLEFRSRGEQRRMWREMRIFADRQADNQEENSKAEADSNPLWSVDSRGAGQL